MPAQKKMTFGIGFAFCGTCLYDSLRYDDVVRHVATSKKCKGAEIVHKPLDQFLDHARLVEERRMQDAESPVSTDSSVAAASKKRRRTTKEYQELFENCVPAYDFAARWDHINARETVLLRKIEELAACDKVHEIPGTLFGRLWGVDAPDALQVIVRGSRWVIFMDGVGPDGAATIQKSQAFKSLREDGLVVPFLRAMPDVLNASEKTRHAVHAAVATVLAAFDTKSTKNKLYRTMAAHLEREFEQLTTVDDPTLYWNFT